jgi:hypothetical protein
VGRYDIARPLSTQTVRAGGDLLIATEDGVVPMSQVAVKDPAAISLAAVTVAIEPSWDREVKRREVGRSWPMLKWQRESLMLIGLPHVAGTRLFVCNIHTGAWALWTGWDVQCLAEFNGLAYFGSTDGRVYLAEGSGSDDGAPYVARYSGSPDHVGTPGRTKMVTQARATFRSLLPFLARLSVAMDYRREFPAPPDAATVPADVALWDAGLWDVSHWDFGPDVENRVTVTTKWRSIGRNGYSVSPQVQITCGGAHKPDAELIAFDMMVIDGGVVV